MKTNFKMVKDLYDKFKPVSRGVLNDEEMSMIREELCISEMDILQLRNLRDFVVLYSSSTISKDASADEMMYNMDRCSGVCAVIDEEIFGKGGEV